MKHRFFMTSFLSCFALCLTTAVPVMADNLLDVVEAAQTAIQKKYPHRDSIARKLALEELEKTARSGNSEEEIIKVILERFPETSDELSVKPDLNSNGVPDEWEKKYNVSAGFTAAESDEDADGFSLLQEFQAGTDPVDPLSHPKFVTRLYVTAVSHQRFADLELASVDIPRPYYLGNKDNWVAAFNVVRNGRKRLEFVHIGGSFKSNDQNGVDFRIVDIDIDPKTEEPVVYISRFDKGERIPCRPKQPVYDPLLGVSFLNAINEKQFVSSVGGMFKLGTDKTGEETYRIVSADPATKVTIVESAGEISEAFKIPPVPAKSAAKNASAKAASSRTPVKTDAGSAARNAEAKPQK